MLIALCCAINAACSSESRSAASSDATAHAAYGGSAPARASHKASSPIRVGGTLAERTAAESASKPRPNNAPPPPGIEPSALAQRAADDPRARASLDQVLLSMSEAAAAAPVNATEPAAIPSDQRAIALKAYAKGRNAALDNRHLQAVTEFQKALAIDPDSPELLREAARSYDAVGNQQRAVELLERLAKVQPDDPEALFALGLAAATRRDFEKAAQHLAKFHTSAEAGTHDPGADVVADFTLATALRELDYDRAFIDLAGSVAEVSQQLAAAAPASRIASVYRQRGDLWRSIGDAHARLGEWPLAITAWTNSASLPSADPSALQPRIIYANLRLGRVYASQSALLEAVRLSVAGGAVNDRDVRLCAYVAEQTQPLEPLAREMLTIQKAHPDDGACARATAMLLPPDQAMALLRGFVERRPDDAQSLMQLMAWLLRDEPASAAALTVSLVAANPERCDEYSDAFGQAAPSFAAAAKAMRAQPPTPARAAVLTQVLSRGGSLGEAWSVCQDALAKWPDDRALKLRLVRLAAAMQEPALVDRAVGMCADINDVPGLIILSQARRSMGQTQAALALAEKAVERGPDDADAQVELARAHAAMAGALAPDQQTNAAARSEVDAAIAAANRAIELDPQNDGGYEVLALIYGPGGDLADSQMYRDALLRLRQANPSSPLYNRLAAQDSLMQRRYDQALERLINAYDGDATDAVALSLAVTAWQQSKRLDAAETWLRERLAQRPGDRLLREQLVRVQLLRNEIDQATTELQQLVEADPEDWTARRLLENVYRVAGQGDSALELGEQRLLARPDGVRRELELADLYAGAELADKALAHLERVREFSNDAALNDLISAMTVAGRVKGDEARRDGVILDLANIAINRHPEAPLQVYGFAMKAVAQDEQRSGKPDDRFDALVREATAKSAGASDTSFRGARLWQELAQALVGENLCEAAARALRVRMAEQPPFDSAAMGAVARMLLVLDAECAYEAGPDDAQAAKSRVQRSMDTLRLLDERNMLQRVFDTPERIDLAQGMHEASALYTLVGADAGAEALMRECLALRPDDAMTLNNLGYKLLEEGLANDEVIHMIEEAYRLEPDENNILDTVGWLRYKQGRLGDDGEAPGAATLIQKAVDSSPDPSPEVFDHLGDVKWRMGDEEGALAAWKRIGAMLDDGAFRERLEQNLAVLQARQWGIIVMEGSRMYDREYAPILTRARAKIDAASRGEQPSVAPQWAK